MWLLLSIIQLFWGFPVSSAVKNLPAMQEAWVWSLGQEDPLEEGMATHSSTLAWKIAWTEKPGGLQSRGLHRVRHNWVTNTHTYRCFTCFVLWTLTIRLVISHFRDESTEAQRESSLSKLVTWDIHAHLQMSRFETRHDATSHSAPWGYTQRSGFVLYLHSHRNS